MDKEKSAVDKFLSDTQEQNMFELPTEQPVEPVAEPAVEPEEKEEEVPFHKNPKVQKFIEKEIDKRLQNIPREAKEVPHETEDDELISAFTNIIGNDTPEKKHALNMLSKTIGDLKEEAQSARREREEERQADLQAEQELEEAFENIENTFDVDLTSQKSQKLRSEFVSFVEKIAPKDRNGDIVDYPDMTSAWETFSEIKKATQVPNRAKELASKSMARSAETVTVQPKKVDWNSVENYIDSLK